MIVTENISLTRKALFNILITAYFRKRWWQVVWLWIMVVILILYKSNDQFGYFIIVALLLLQGIIVFQLWSNTNDESFLKERHFEIDSDKVTVINLNGTSTSYEILKFRNVIKTSKYYLLYLNKVDFIYIPFCSFKMDEDRKWFDNEIVEKIKRF